MNKAISFFYLLLFTLQVHAAPFAHIFDTSIYDQAHLNNATDQEKIQELDRRKLQLLTTKKLVSLDRRIAESNQLISLYEHRKTQMQPFIIAATVFDVVSDSNLWWIAWQNLITHCMSTVSTCTLGLIPAPAVGGPSLITYVEASARRAGDAATLRFLPLPQAESTHRQLTQERQNLLTNVSNNDAHHVLECAYVVKKFMIPHNYQDKIEALLIAAYDDDQFLDAILISDLINHPLIKKAFNPDKIEGLYHTLTSTDKARDLAERMVWDIATTDTRHIAYVETHPNDPDFLVFAEDVAKALNLPYMSIDAADIVTTEAGLYGRNIQNQRAKGLFLKPFTQVKNPILIIKNIDQLVVSDNMPWLLKLFDVSEKYFHSSYFELPVDWSHLNIICCGATPHDQLESAFQSRTSAYNF